MTCKHMDFKVNCNIGRLQAGKSDQTIVGFTMDVNVECAECGKPFEFIGLPMGSSPMQPMCSVDGLEARLPIMPMGETMRTDLPGFTIKRVFDGW